MLKLFCDNCGTEKEKLYAISISIKEITPRGQATIDGTDSSPCWCYNCLQGKSIGVISNILNCPTIELCQGIG